jgi:hypothetical protein
MRMQLLNILLVTWSWNLGRSWNVVWRWVRRRGVCWTKEVQIADFVIVAIVATTKTLKHFVAKVIEINKDAYTVKYLRKKEKCFIYPQVDDMFSVS